MDMIHAASTTASTSVLCINNMNYVSHRADMDGTVDETSWGFGGFMADCGQRLINKPVSKGGQIIMMYDVNNRYP